VERKTDPVLERNFLTLSQFREHLRLLKQCRVLSVTDLLGETVRSAKGVRPAIVITFDDGYANNLMAAEILHRLCLPWVLFVSTGVLKRDRCLWTTELALLLLHGEATLVEIKGTSWPLHSREERERVFEVIRKWMKGLPAPQRRQTLENLRQQFPEGETQRLLSQFPSLQMLTWDKVAQLAAAGVTIGSHGVEHEIHHPAQPESVRRWEIAASKQEIECRIGKPCIAFAYPNGNFLPESEKELRESGYQLGFTTEPGTASSGISRYYLPRIQPRHSLQSFVEDLFFG
jgi:peptidoglycan/xylan/chitin deacetylase (PgdA/CDA1 family)